MITFPLHKFDGSVPFKIHQFEKDSQRASYPHRHDFFQILYIKEGWGFHIIDAEAYCIHSPILYFLPPHQINTQTSFFQSLFERPYLSLPDSVVTHFNTLCQTMTEEYHHKHWGYTSILAAYVHILLTQIERLAPLTSLENKSLAQRRVQAFRQLISQYCLVERLLSFYAEQIGVTADYLSQQVKALTGYTASELIRQEVALEAKRLLVNTELTTQQIAYQLGFDDPAYFARFFRRETQMNPLRFRHLFREKYPFSLE